MEKFIVSAFSDEYSSDFDTQLSILSEYGFDMIEPRFIDGKNISELNVSEVKSVKDKLAKSGLAVSSIGSPLGKIKTDDDFKSHLELTKRVCETANILGTENVRMFSFYPADDMKGEDFKPIVTEKLSKMIDIAVSEGITLCHENEAKIFGESPQNCLELMKTFEGKLKCVFDMGNFVLDGHDPLKGYELLKDYIQYFHIKDSLYEGAIVPPGLGEAKVEEIIKKHLEYTGNDVIITLEPHLETFDGLNSLVGKNFENPYKFNSKEEAFITAINKLRSIIQ